MFEPYSLTKTIAMTNDMLSSHYYTQQELELTLNQKRLLMYLVSRINKDDQCFNLEEFPIKNYCDLFGIEYNGGTRKKEIRKSLLSIGKKVFILPTDAKGQQEQLFRWVDDIKIDYNKGTIAIKLAECLRPYYLQIKDNFTIYQLGYTTSFRSKYAYTLYEICKSKAGMVKFYMSIEDVHLQLAYNKYKTYTDLIRFVVEPAIKEVNKYTDLKVSYKPYKNGKKVEKLLFCVTKKSGVELAEADKWKVSTDKKRKIENAMDRNFAYEVTDAEDRMDNAEYEERQYDRMMQKYAENA